MRIPDRYWWLQRAAGLALALVLVVVAVWFATNPDPVTEFRQNGLGFIIFILAAVLTIRESFRSHDHYRSRLAALHGDLDAIPLANIAVHADNVPNVAAEPLELMWHATRLWGRIFTIYHAIIYVLLGGTWLVILLSMVYAIYLLATTKPIQPLTFDFITVMSLAMVAVGSITLLLGLPLAIGIIGRYWPRDHGRPFGLSASSEGITYVPGVGRRRLIRWEDMRLLEEKTTIGSYTQKEYRSYQLYGRDAIAEWQDAPPSAWVIVGTVGMTSGEYGARHLALLDLIAARTGLTPRTFDTARRGRGNR